MEHSNCLSRKCKSEYTEMEHLDSIQNKYKSEMEIEIWSEYKKNNKLKVKNLLKLEKDSNNQKRNKKEKKSME